MELISYHVNLPPDEAQARLRGFLAATLDFKKPEIHCIYIFASTNTSEYNN